MKDDLRSLFPALAKEPDWVYLDSAATAHKPKVVIDAMRDFYADGYATVHRSIYAKSLAATEKYHGTRLSVQRFLHAKEVEEIVFTKGTTDGINLVATSLSTFFEKGDEILLSEAEHHSNLVPWQMLAQKKGAIVRFIPIDDRGVLDMQTYSSLLNPKTKLVAICHMSNVTGTVHPIKEIVRVAHQMNAKVLVDGAQAAAHMPVDVQDLDVDFYVFSGHKCYGPTGVGILYGKRKWLDEMPPVQGGGDMVDEVFLEKSSYQQTPLKFEAGTPMIGSVIALKPALDFLMDLGMEKIAAWEKKLLIAAFDQVKEIPGIRFIGLAPEKGALLTFIIEGFHPLDIATFADLKNISIRSGHLCAQTALRRFGLKTAARASFGLYNTLEDAKKLGEALRSVVSVLSQ